VASALEAVHQAGMLHRDVKPENVLFDRVHRRYVLIDVGVAVRQGGEKNPAGTPGFTAPEVFTKGNEGPWTDVYGLGAVAYALLTLETPYEHGPPLKVVSWQMNKPPRPLSMFRKDLPERVGEILAAALDPDPERRPTSATTLARSLGEALSRRPGSHPPQPRITPASIPTQDTQTELRGSPWAASLTPPPSEPSSRGVLFRSAFPVLGGRRGNEWQLEVIRESPELAAPLGPQSSPLGWFPTSALITMLRSLGRTESEARARAVEVGRRALESSFGIVYGADPSAVSPMEVLRAADVFWHAYHNWGLVTVGAQDQRAEVKIENPVAHKLLCATIEGMLLEVIDLSGGLDAECRHAECAADGGEKCVYGLSWRLPPEAG
jgi:hypothetical protein